MKDFAQRKTAEDQFKDRSLPDDYRLDDLPTGAQLWLGRAGIDEATRRTYDVGFSRKLNRVIIPVKRGGNVVGSIARAIEQNGPKYLSNVPPFSIFDSVSGRPPKDQYAEYIVLAEDILSAIRVGRFVRTLALLGTSSGDAYIGRVLGELGATKRVAIWLDPDNAGQRATTELLRSLSMAGIQVTKIESLRDPKLHSDREIQEYLKLD